MDLSYQQPQPYRMYEHPQWTEDYKPNYIEAEHHIERDERPPASTTSTYNANPHSRRQSVLKVEDEYSPNDNVPTWHERQHQAHYPIRHYSHSSVHSHGHPQRYMRADPNFAASYAQPEWSMPQSGTSTPTPAYSSVDSYSAPVQYANHASFDFNQDPISAVSMSPQSSQGGWASATSSDGMEQRCMIQSPVFRPMSPQSTHRADGLVQRSDGIRKKNARFEIPRERNLHTIDALIMSTTDETEKKELKQQKRLLRNRQAALDSRQRKKSHTEKLEQEKKHHEKRMVGLEEAVTQLQEQLQIEREQWATQRQQYDIQVNTLLHERNEAIRQKTIEAADTRRQLNAMKEYCREQSQRSHGYTAASDINNMASDFSEIGFDDDWEHEFSLIDNSELDNMQRQATPKPSTMAVASKADTDFSWNTLYMCLLFGAVVVSAGGQISKLGQSTTEVALPAVSDLNRADAQNVLNALSSDSQSAQDMGPSNSAMAIACTSAPQPSAAGIDFSYTPAESRSSFEELSSALTTPSRHQYMQQALSMTPASYNHITNPLAGFDDDADADLPDSPRPKPAGSRLEQAMRALNANKTPAEKAGFISRAQERSALNVPDSVMVEFRAFVQETRQSQTENQQQSG
ncbi:hypothetical protein LTS08_002009 [Lithohypha guttulata]|uniref:uncharacterized protein n=1 Tax=Lithohypha guttulata TaxID=1690604 RepID=UPI002DDFEA27|nr:hypothetical protein LTR51_004476 [Lithohypha guttulata]KAK5104125.1 hypothetical protein LTS08_002009 [Lithohypha guttulata]